MSDKKSKKPAKALHRYFFPSEGVSVEAKDLEEAINKVIKQETGDGK